MNTVSNPKYSRVSNITKQRFIYEVIISRRTVKEVCEFEINFYPFQCSSLNLGSQAVSNKLLDWENHH